MKWSFRLGRIAGIDIYLHATFGILLLWFGVSELFRVGDLRAAALSVAFVAAIFATIVAHELGHALTARRYGIRTRDITLYPIGGVARLERMPENPRHELLVALAGPAVSFAIAAVLFAVVLAAGAVRPPTLQSPTGSFVTNLAWANLAIAVFNLIPAFPMDGGRALRALLAMRHDYVRATRTAARLGQALALVFGVIGLFYNPMLLFIALFVWVAATSEAYATEVRASLEGIPVGSAMVTHFAILSPNDPIGRVADYAVAGVQDDFPVVEANVVVGMLTRSRLLDALAGAGGALPVRQVMDRTFVIADPSEMVADVLGRLATGGCRSAPVVWRGRLVGLLAMDQVAELMSQRPSRVGPREMDRGHWTPWWRDKVA